MEEPANIKLNLGAEYINHSIWRQLDDYIEFYESLSFLVCGFIPHGTLSLTNIDTYTLSSIKCTIESIKDILKKARVSDAYALVRKYYDSTIINVYVDLYLQDNVYKTNNFVVEKIDNWIKGKDTIPEYRIISKYIQDSNKLSAINEKLKSDNRYKKIRKRCNDNMHYNSYYNYILNDNEIYNPNRFCLLNQIAKDMENLFIQHFAYLFSLNDHYMMSSDYVDALDLGLQPEENSQYWVAKFVQDAFDTIIKIQRPDIAKALKNNTNMYLKYD